VAALRLTERLAAYARAYALVYAAVALPGVASPVAAQQTAPPSASADSRPRLTLDLPPDSLLTRRGPTVRATGMLSGARMSELLLAGFPARFHFRVELSSEGRFFDQLEGVAEFDAGVRYLPAERVYEVVHVLDDRVQSLGKFAQLADAERAVARPTIAPIAARPMSRTQYYEATLRVEVLSERDLDEVGRWLQGEVRPVLTGKSNPASFLVRGVRTVASRLLGGEQRGYDAQSPRFRVP